MQAYKPHDTEAVAISPAGQLTANTFTTKDGTVIYYKDWGTGPAVAFSPGYPLSRTPGKTR